MRRAFLLGLVAVVTGSLVGGCACGGRGTCPSTSGKVLRHLVLFAWKADAPAEKIREIEAAFAALPSQVGSVTGFEWGTDVSVEGLSQGYTHAFLVTFKDEAGRAAYLPHPAHQAFVALMKPYLEKVLVLDYWTH